MGFNAEGYAIAQRMMTISGIWPNQNPSTFYTLRRLLTYFMSIALVGTLCVEVYHSRSDFARFSRIVHVTIPSLLYNIKLFSFLYYHEEFARILERLEDKPILSSIPTNLDGWKRPVRFARLLSKVYICGVLTIVVQYIFIPLIDRRLPLPFPYDLGRFALLLYVFQVVGLVTIAWNNTALLVAVVALSSISIGHLTVLQETLKNMGRHGTQGKDKDDEIVQCVSYHNAIIELVSNIETVFSIGLFFNFLSSIIAICNSLLNIILILEFTIMTSMTLMYSMVMLLQLYLHCWFGNELMLKGLGVGDACYMSEWYNCSEKSKKSLLQIIQRSERPLALTALRFATLSLTTFTLIMRWCYSYLTMMINMYQKGSFGKSSEC